MPAPSILASGDALADPRNVLSSIGEVVYGWDVTTDGLSWGPNAHDVLGALPAAARDTGLGFAGLVEPGSGRSRYDAIFSTGASDSGDGVVYRTRYVVALGSRRVWIDDSGRWFAGSDGRPASARGVVRLDRAARPEELSATPSEVCDRGVLVARVDSMLAESLPQERPFALIVAAIDELARLNDDFGHEATDEIILAVRDRLRSVMRRRDQLLRYSGNRFAILLAGCPATQLEEAARRFIRAVGRSAVETERGIALIRLRAGAASAPEIARLGGPLVAAAEGALSTAKAGDADDVVIARPGAPRLAADARSLDVEAVAALNDRRVTLALQPIVRATTRETAFSEALLRVGRDADGIHFAAAELIPMLESRGLVRLFDHRVLELAVEMLESEPARSLSVNVSPRSLSDPEWLDAFLAMTHRRPALASRLVVEVTETATIADSRRTRLLLERIKGQGARVAIDDFGVGHTSLRHLRDFPIDILKLDGTFTQNLRRSTDDRFYVRTLIDLARHLEVETVAEWVDDEVQARMLADWGVTYLQGHLVGKAELAAALPPLPAVQRKIG